MAYETLGLGIIVLFILLMIWFVCLMLIPFVLFSINAKLGKVIELLSKRRK